MGIRLSLEFRSDVKSEMAMEFGRSEKKSKNESSQNDELYSGKCAQTLGEYFGGIATSQNGHIKLKIQKIKFPGFLIIFIFPIFPISP